MANLTTTTTKAATKSVGDPSASYESLRTLWKRSRAVLNGQAQAKAYDDILDVYTYKNLLLPFSPKMTQEQFNFYRAEAELPGLVSQYAKVLVGGLLRKPPQLTLPDSVPEGAESWLKNNFSADGIPMLSFLDEAIWEELQTSRAWIIVDHPEVDNYDELSPEQRDMISPYAMVVKAENVINWRKGKGRFSNAETLTSLVMRYYMPNYDSNPFHPDYVDTVSHYYLDEEGYFVTDTYQRRDTNDTVDVINGNLSPQYIQSLTTQDWSLISTQKPLMQGERIPYIPAFPLNGQVDPIEPALQPLVDREVSLYNKISRRNHLLYGAATYTPVVMSDMTDEQFDDIVGAGLGSWIHLRKEDSIKALETPTGSLSDMENAISATVEEMAKMGIRMLSPEGSGQSGVALEIRNAAQTAQLGLLNNKISKTMQSVITVMLNWKYGLGLNESDVDFTLSADFNPTPMGADWMRLITDWYQQGIIPRSTFIAIAKQNDILPIDYNDDEGVSEIQTDPLVGTNASNIDASILENLKTTLTKGV